MSQFFTVTLFMCISGRKANFETRCGMFGMWKMMLWNLVAEGLWEWFCASKTAWRSTYLCLCMQHFWQALADRVKHTVCVWTWSDIPLVWSPTSIFGMISHVRMKGSFRTSLCSAVRSQYIQMYNVGKSSFMYWVHMHVVLCYRWRQIGWFSFLFVTLNSTSI